MKPSLLHNLTTNILPYWIDRMVDPAGGFYGRRDGHDRLDPSAPKGAILNARILWTFSSAYRMLGTPEYLTIATRAYDYIREHFIDREFGGTFWSLNPDGTPLDTKKQFYAIGFMIYGLSEYYRATGCEDALSLAYELFACIETHSRDRRESKEGYFEAATRDWQPIADMRLSDKDANASKTMNTHLHIIEGYTNLLRALKERNASKGSSVLSVIDDNIDIAVVEEATVNLLRIFLDKIENPKTHHLTLFFNDDWEKLDDTESYGHDIEASWLLLETAQGIDDAALLAETLEHTRHIAFAGLQGRCYDGSMVYERHANGHYDNDKHWWVQAEDVIGQLYLAAFHGMPEQLDRARQSWQYITDNLVDPDGEWYWSRLAPENTPHTTDPVSAEPVSAEADSCDSNCHGDNINRRDDKAGFWKCPYHNSRMCLESIHILDKYLTV